MPPAPTQSFSLVQMLGRSAPVIDIVDVGAYWLGQEHIPYRALLKHGSARVIGFEPAPGECEKLNAMKMPGHTYLPYFIGDGTERTFVLTNAPMTSSLCEPDLRLCGHFTELAEMMQPVERTKVATKRLDDIPEIGSIDLLKVDVQGGEVDVFRGADRLLRTTLVVHTEINLVPQYTGGALFADVDRALRAHGFEFHTFPTLMGRTFKPVAHADDPYRAIRQMLWGDAVYVRSFMDFASLDADALLKIAVILHEVYGSYDLAALALRHYDARSKGGLWRLYMTRLMGGKAPPDPPPLP
jgi:protein O-GlcNAc transferase